MDCQEVLIWEPRLGVAAPCCYSGTRRRDLNSWWVAEPAHITADVWWIKLLKWLEELCCWLIAKLFEYLPVCSLKSVLNLDGLDPAIPPFHENAITWVDMSLKLMTLWKEGRRNQYSELFGVLFKEVFAPDFQNTWCGRSWCRALSQAQLFFHCQLITAAPCAVRGSIQLF